MVNYVVFVEADAENIDLHYKFMLIVVREG